MPRTIAAELVTALQGPSRRPYVALEMDLDSAPVRIWAGHGNRTIEGETYLGVAHLLSVGGIEENNDLASTSLSATLQCTQALIALALGEDWQNRPCKVMLGDLSVASVLTYFEGFVDALPWTDDPTGERRIDAVFEHNLAELDDAPNFKYTQAVMKARHPTDTFLDYVNDIIDKEIPWGRKSADVGSVQTATPTTNVPRT